MDSVDESSLAATFMNGVTCSADGILLDGIDDYVVIDNWEWGSTTSFEVYVKYDSFNRYSRVFDFGNGDGSDSVSLYNGGEGDISVMWWNVHQGSIQKPHGAANCESATWMHIVLTVKDTTMKMYKNGVLADETNNGHEPNVITRSSHTIGANKGMSSFFDGTIAYVKMWHGVELTASDVTSLYAPHNTAHHFWDFRGCTTGAAVMDSIAGDLAARPFSGPTCSSGGIVMDGIDDYVQIDNWEWGGTTSFEVYVQYHSFNDASRVFSFSNGQSSDNVFLYNGGTSSPITFGVLQGSTNKFLSSSNFDTAPKWTHVIATVKDTTIKVYKNGLLVGTNTEAHEPNVMTRTKHWLGLSTWSNVGGTFDGAIAYVKVWHGVELTSDNIFSLFKQACAAGEFFDSALNKCSPCGPGMYSESPGSATCTSCPKGKTHFISASTSASDCSHDSVHSWNFMGCSNGVPVVDDTEGSTLKATVRNGATCSTEGIVFDGVDDWVDIDDWEWGGTTSFEVYVKYDSFKSGGSHVFDFSSGENSDNVIVYNVGDSSAIRWSVCQSSGITCKHLDSSNFDTAEWSHVVVTVKGTTMKLFKNGVLVGTNTNGIEPRVVTRTQHWLGRSAWSTHGYFDGTIASLKVWHNTELTETEIRNLPKMPCLPGTFGSGYPDCMVCAAGSYSTGTGSSSCTTCPKGTYLDDDRILASNHDNAEDCRVCEAGKYNHDNATAPNLHVSCTICESGTYNAFDNSNASNHYSCTLCPIGKKNDATSVEDHNSADDCELCSPGTFASLPGAAVCEPCEEGLSSGNGASSCSQCPAGYVCTSDGRQEPCPSGKYSSGSSACLNCNEGYRCPGATDKILCPAATYQEDQGQRNCKVCEAGTYGPEEGLLSCLECPQGHFCPRASATPITCGSVALFCPSGSSGVTPVSPGHYTAPVGDETTMTRSTQIMCEVGYACIGGNREFCGGEGQYADEVGLSSCKIATAGQKASADHSGSEVCPAGTFSVGGTSECTGCEAGKFSAQGAVGCTSAATCGVGEFVKSASTLTTDTECEVCRAGKASMGGNAAECTACDKNGEYSDTDKANACKLAPAGTKPSTNRTAIEFCPRNTFSIGASNECTPCAEGGHSFPGSSACETCPQYEAFDDLTESCACMGSFKRIGGICTCKSGETLMGTSCSPCELGKWKDEVGVTSCSRCETTLAGAITANLGSTHEAACICPMATFDNGEGKCVEIVEGIRNDIEGLTLETLTLFPGWWRTANTSDDIRECLIAEACVGGNSTNMCREGHDGPYCNICVENYNPDPFGICKECAYSKKDVMFTCWVAVAIVVFFVVFKFLVKKKFGGRGKGKNIWKRMKSGVKVMFASGQITASLPRVVPSLALPKSYEKVVEASQVLKLDIFTLVPVGCWTGGTFNYYDRTVAMTLPVIALCSTCFLLGFLTRKNRFYTVAIVVTYLTLPTITTTVFGLFPCDPLDDGRYFLRADYHIRCDDEGRFVWGMFGAAMVFTFPVCVPALYFFLLWKKKDKIRKPVEERSKDEDIHDIIFLWDPYKPEFWYWEVVETLRRLGMTGLLSIIKPGTFTQLTTGLIFAAMYTVLLSKLEPYQEARDSRIAILSSAMVELTFIASYLMKAQDFVEDGYEARGLGLLMVIATALIFVFFLLWGWNSLNDVSKSTNSLAANILGGSRKRERKGSDGTVAEDELQMSDLSPRKNSLFEVGNPMAKKGGKKVEDKKAEASPVDCHG